LTKTRLQLLAFAALILTGVAAQCQAKELNCVDSGNQKSHVIFDEAAGTAMFSAVEGQDGPSSPATFTEREIKWDYDTRDELTGHPYFSLNRTTGELLITHYKQKGPDWHHSTHCELSQQKY
jgi:hypothetical protein